MKQLFKIVVCDVFVLLPFIANAQTDSINYSKRKNGHFLLFKKYKKAI
ncbi:MAG: hypothetical protein V9E96_10770 [Chitinophagaceae bacterium]